ncbi:MAG TPA: VOC family protein [Candidatus Binatia bacterium]|nr:VOC family protein [Candidatus Binatia bacterium]
METVVARSARDQATVSRQPRFSGLSHVSLACRDLVESKLFHSAVFGGELVHEIRGFVEYRIADVIFGLAEQNQGWTAPDHEYPHYAFYLDGANFERMIHWLDLYNVPNYPYRRDATALLYFRDPSGNLFELYCDTGYERIASLPAAPRRGGAPIDFRSLNYHWSGNRAADSSGTQKPQFSGFAHASLYCRDLAQAKRFFTNVMSGELIHDVDSFAEARVAGVIIGITIRPGTTTSRDAEYPHYAFFVEPKDFLPMLAWLRQNGVNTSEPWTRDGVKGLVYFRDPAGNLFEMYCPKLSEAASFVRGKKQGGSYEIDFAALNYEWQG